MRKARVLVVDDSVVCRRLVSSILAEEEGVEVVGTAPNGRIALDKVAQHDPDVVVLDIEMPEMDGLTALALLRERHPRTKVVMFSVLTERGARATLEALALGASDYATKPLRRCASCASSSSRGCGRLPRRYPPPPRFPPPPPRRGPGIPRSSPSPPRPEGRMRCPS
jgi:two-component system chemotaxis response regulator CheB